MKVLRYILLLLLILFIGFSIFIAVQPNSYKVTRNRIIKAPVSMVYNNVIDFKNWEAWSSWKEEKPETVFTLSEQTEGIGGSYSWKDEDGIGIMKTVNAKPNAQINQTMQFADMPEADVIWNLKANNNGTTNVTWTITAKDLPFKFKLFSALMGGMEKQIGPHFEQGLNNLEAVLQAEMKVYNISVQGITEHSGGYYLYATASCKLSDFEKNMKAIRPKVGSYALTHNITMAGPPFILYHKWDEENDAALFSYCVPTNSKIISSEEEILTGKLKSFKAVKTVLKGDYANLRNAWDKTMTYISDYNLEIIEVGPMIETYLTPTKMEQNPAKWISEIYVAIK